MNIELNNDGGGFESMKSKLDNFSKLKPQMDRFNNTLVEFLSKAKSELHKRAVENEREIKQLKKEESEILADIEHLQDIKNALMGELASEMSERDSNSLKLKEMKAQQFEFERQLQVVKTSLVEIGDKIGQKVSEIERSKEMISNQNGVIMDRLYQFERLLGLRIEQAKNVYEEEEEEEEDEEEEQIQTKPSLIKFIFYNVDPDDYEKEVWFVLNATDLVITSSEPPLSSATIEPIVDEFVRDKEVGYLWKKMRLALKSALLARG
ncbi:hypothetical protein DAMA08_053150 [Martiniozyma asiatica (nom. inval.)]|nr:hypothetical protein DAMA08_053150 [Martiniozyma asiatica]